MYLCLDFTANPLQFRCRGWCLRACRRPHSPSARSASSRGSLWPEGSWSYSLLNPTQWSLLSLSKQKEQERYLNDKISKNVAVLKHPIRRSLCERMMTTITYLTCVVYMRMNENMWNWSSEVSYNQKWSHWTKILTYKNTIPFLNRHAELNPADLLPTYCCCAVCWLVNE